MMGARDRGVCGRSQGCRAGAASTPLLPDPIGDGLVFVGIDFDLVVDASDAVNLRQACGLVFLCRVRDVSRQGRDALF